MCYYRSDNVAPGYPLDEVFRRRPQCHVFCLFFSQFSYVCKVCRQQLLTIAVSLKLPTCNNSAHSFQCFVLNFSRRQENTPNPNNKYIPELWKHPSRSEIPSWIQIVLQSFTWVSITKTLMPNDFQACQQPHKTEPQCSPLAQAHPPFLLLSTITPECAERGGLLCFESSYYFCILYLVFCVWKFSYLCQQSLASVVIRGDLLWFASSYWFALLLFVCFLFCILCVTQCDSKILCKNCVSTFGTGLGCTAEDGTLCDICVSPCVL